MTIVVDSDTPYDYLSEDRANVLNQLLTAVPAAKKLFDEGSVPAALAKLREATNVRLHPSTGMTKNEFLYYVSMAMPNKYSL